MSGWRDHRWRSCRGYIQRGEQERGRAGRRETCRVWTVHWNLSGWKRKILRPDERKKATSPLGRWLCFSTGYILAPSLTPHRLFIPSAHDDTQGSTTKIGSDADFTRGKGTTRQQSIPADPMTNEAVLARARLTWILVAFSAQPRNWPSVIG